MKSVSEIALGLVVACAVLSCRAEVAPDEKVTAKASIGCANCHTPEFQTTSHPPHPNVRPTACGVCHTQSGWHGWRVAHPFWALTGAHARIAADEKPAGVENQVKCFWCHREDSTTFKVKNKKCIGCHEEDKEKAEPPHADFSTACETCHSTEDWKNAKEPAAKPKEPEPEPAPTAKPGVDAGAAPVKPKPKPPSQPPPPSQPQPPKPVPTAKPPDVLTGPSSRHH